MTSKEQAVADALGSLRAEDLEPEPAVVELMERWGRGEISDAEQYTYSAVWLAFGVALLAAGVGLRSQAVRFASAAVVILTVLKVFLIDMSDLTGIFQGLSFIGLGIVLLGIGWLYQRLLFPRRAGTGASPA